jgi:hypothetical protein
MPMVASNPNLEAMANIAAVFTPAKPRLPTPPWEMTQESAVLGDTAAHATPLLAQSLLGSARGWGWRPFKTC